MSNIRHQQITAAGRVVQSATSRRKYALLPDADRQQLMRHLAWCEAARESSSPFLAPVIRNRIETSLRCDAEHPAETVIGGCRVIYSINGAPAQTGLVTHTARKAAQDSGVIPVSSQLGATLIGLRVGQTVPMLCEGGTVARLAVLAVRRPT